MSFIASLLCGVLSGFGIGGGTLLIIIMTGFLSVPQLKAQGINLIYFIPTASSSLLGHIKNRLVDKTVFLWTTIPGTIATALASLALSNFSDAIARKIFGAFLLVVGVMEFFGKKKS